MVLSTERTIVFEMTVMTEIFLLKVAVYLIAEVNTYERRKHNEYNRINEMIGRNERASGVRRTHRQWLLPLCNQTIGKGTPCCEVRWNERDLR